ncbi:hypothetical protein GOP47_0021662 [Adiantum capillus-veneris]|uniref:Glycosyltransferase n=1 Tax=Adiantum capillus-veneris TaxID=13818 RepID=A0A9D4Z6S1_ADICA|nr:hypothetical protein GOP47_0021662 [Adiantum capillus-veneris]
MEVHALLVPFPLEGHINGLLRLAHALAAHQGLFITFAYPARLYSLAHSRNKIPLADSSSRCNNLRIKVIPDGLPTEAEVVPSVNELMAAVFVFQSGIETLLDRQHSSQQQLDHDVVGMQPPPIACIISDTFVPWTQDLANKAKLPRVEFWTSTAAVYAMGTFLPELISKGHLPVKHGKEHKPWIVDAPLLDFIPGLPPFPVTDLPHEFISSPDPESPMFQFMLSAFSRFKEAQRILVHSVYELESNVFDALTALDYPIRAVGPLFNDLHEKTDLQEELPAAVPKHECLQWLDKQKPASVVYVALGTLSTIKLKELEALALGLEDTGHPFLWVLRIDALSEGSLSDSASADLIKQSVEQGLGCVVPWAPQTEVLKHASIGAFFSHCGWNSTIESLWEGVPMVACPRGAEQRSNARWIVENWKVGVEVVRDEEDGSFTKEGVRTALDSVMGVKGESVKERALVLQEVIRTTMQPGGTSHSNLVDFAEYLRKLPGSVADSV